MCMQIFQLSGIAQLRYAGWNVVHVSSDYSVTIAHALLASAEFPTSHDAARINAAPRKHSGCISHVCIKQVAEELALWMG